MALVEAFNDVAEFLGAGTKNGLKPVTQRIAIGLFDGVDANLFGIVSEPLILVRSSDHAHDMLNPSRLYRLPAESIIQRHVRPSCESYCKIIQGPIYLSTYTRSRHIARTDPSGMPPHRFGIGQAVRRKEDDRFLRGKGRFLDDLTLDGQVHLAFVRAPYAHAEIRAIDTTDARHAAGVVDVLTEEDYRADGLALPRTDFLAIAGGAMRYRDGTTPQLAENSVLAAGVVRYVGQPIAVVIAESAMQAHDAADRIIVDYAPRSAVVNAVDALASGAPLLWDDIPGNLCIDVNYGDAAACDRALAEARYVARIELVNNRVAVCPMETRGVVAQYESGPQRLTIHTNTQSTHRIRDILADDVFLVPRERVRVISPDVGGGFGGRSAPYPEIAVAGWCARRLERPVKWISDRSESFLSDTQGRDNISCAELGVDDEGRFLGLRVSTVANLGAYPGRLGPIVPAVLGPRVQNGVYAIPVIDIRVRAAYTNTMTVAPYRGAGQPEAVYLIERLIEEAARLTRIDGITLRRRNHIPATAMPFRTVVGVTYDSGDYDRNLVDALSLADWDGFDARCNASRQRSLLRGRGVANYIQVAAGVPREWGALAISGKGEITIETGMQGHGQGHETVFAQLISYHLGVPFDRVRLVQGDTDLIPEGAGTHGSRSTIMAAALIDSNSETILRQARRIAALHLEVSDEDLVFAEGRFSVAGTDLACDLFEIAALCEAGSALPERPPGPLRAEASYVLPDATYPSGMHVCEVEVDSDTGAVRVDRFAAIDEVGRAINPLLLHGQSHGGIAQGIGQALMEWCRYDRESGQLLTGSFLDYAVPRADDLPSITVGLNEVPSPTNRLGVKGAGESGSTGAPAAVINAILDALRPIGVFHIDMPATPERVWRAIREAYRTA